MTKPTKAVLYRKLHWSFLSALVGILSGLSSTLFLYLLNWATQYRMANPIIMIGLPVAGFLIGWMYHAYGKDVVEGNNLILDEIHNPKKVIPFAMAPFILIGTIITHLFGGSAGREGTAVQMGASLADQLTHFFNISKEDRKIVLMAGAGAGFSAAIGTPLAGAIFGMEVIHIGKLKPFAILECLIASYVGYFTAVLLRAPHSHFPLLTISDFSVKAFFWVAVAGMIFGATAKLFIFLTHQVEKAYRATITYAPLKPLIGGLLVILFFYIEGTYRYAGLGIPFIQEAFHIPVGFQEPLLKTLFTALTIGSGFKGGEFIPLVYIGTTLGSALSMLLPLSFPLLASLGFAAVFGAAANTPIACAIMAAEIFGYDILPYALVACLAGYYISGNYSIYKSQPMYSKVNRNS